MEGANTYYYHNDHLGTPQKMTDSSGTVVWSADYKPFGEATVTVSTITNNLRFPGQYYDAETGLHYNYWRDYETKTGRYLESDRIGLAGGINLFVYVGGEPIDWFDAVGLWPSQKGAYIHQRAIYLIIGNNLPENLRMALINGQVYADSGQFQNGASAFRHAMRNKDTAQSACEARKLANDFVRSQFKKAWDFKKNGLEEAALFELSVGLHLLQDWTSPTHHGFQEWSDNPSSEEVFLHTLGELYNPGSNSELYSITRDAWKWYTNGALPRSDLFGSYGAD